MNVAKFALSRKDLLGPLAGLGEGAREGAEEFNDLGDVVVIFSVFGAGLRVEEVVACDEFENLEKKLSALLLHGRFCQPWDCAYHSSHTPYVSTGAPFGAQNDFWRTILSSLNIICEVMADPARVPEIGNLD